jgi:hypothetical protein
MVYHGVGKSDLVKGGLSGVFVGQGNFSIISLKVTVFNVGVVFGKGKRELLLKMF